MVKQPCGVIYALVLTLLMIPPVALALMSGRVLAAEPQMPDLKPLFEFLDMLDRIWLGMALKSQGPKSWDGVWPSSRMVLYPGWHSQTRKVRPTATCPPWRSTSNQAELLKNT
jgi:hypothetical protein